MSVSVILPVNENKGSFEDYFNKAIQSLVNQEVKPQKVYVVCSTDKKLKSFLDSWEKPEELDIVILENTGKTDFCSQVNYGVEKMDTEWFSVLEFDDEYSRHWFKNTQQYIKAYDEIDIFLPLVVDVDVENKFLGFTNESVWAMKFSEKLGILDNNTLLNYQNYQLSGAVIKKEFFDSVGLLKPSMKLTFIYEFLLRATYNDAQVMTIPKIGYKHANMREFSLFWDYKHGSEPLEPEEANFWVEQAKKEYFFTYDRAVEYEN